MLRLSVFIFLMFVSFADAEELRIGALLPLSGPIAEPGAEIRNGMTLALEELKRTHPSIRIIFEDTAFDPKQAASAARKVIEQDKVHVVVSLWDTSDVVAPIADQAGIVHVAIRWDPSLTENRPLTFTLEPTYLSWVRESLALLHRFNFQTVLLVGQEAKSTVQAFAEIERTAAGYGLTLVGKELFPPGETDFRSLLARSLQKNPDLVFVVAYPPQSELLIEQLKRSRPTQRFGGILELVKRVELIERVPSVVIFRASEDFREKYHARFGEHFQTRAPHGYEIVRLLARVVDRLGAEKRALYPSAIAEKLSLVQGEPSVLGPISVTPSRNIEHPTAQEIVWEGRRVPFSEDLLDETVWGARGSLYGQ